MSNTSSSRISLAALVLLAACGDERPPGIVNPAPTAAFDAFAEAEWSEPVNLAPLNTAFNDRQAFLSKDQLTIYFSSDRPTGLGGLDIWMSRRASVGSEWETPMNLGAPINSPGQDFAPSFSIDGHVLFFSSNRPGGHGGTDVYMSRRDNPHDDFGWSEPVNVGPPVNTPSQENAPFYLQNGGEGMAQLYFNRAIAAGPADIYRIAMRRSGEFVGSESLVTELSDPLANDAAVSIRRDGREIWFWSTRGGSVGNTDLWVSTRQTIHHPWSAPGNPGTPLNSEASEVTPLLSFDGRTLIFGSARDGGFGAHDLWMSTRRERSR